MENSDKNKQIEQLREYIKEIQEENNGYKDMYVNNKNVNSINSSIKE